MRLNAHILPHQGLFFSMKHLTAVSGLLLYFRGWLALADLGPTGTSYILVGMWSFLSILQIDVDTADRHAFWLVGCVHVCGHQSEGRAIGK